MNRNNKTTSEEKNRNEDESLKIQNLRLIESNYDLVRNMIGLIDFCKKYLNIIIKNVDEFRYLEVSKISHEMLRRILEYKTKENDFGTNMRVKI